MIRIAQFQDTYLRRDKYKASSAAAEGDTAESFIEQVSYYKRNQ